MNINHERMRKYKSFIFLFDCQWYSSIQSSVLESVISHQCFELAFEYTLPGVEHHERAISSTGRFI